ncbi:hypothetical protein TNCV_1653291 [Trichonephila clavipes]|nr:hypothetical protein TNCV_1653291 [Trichonephila clavipes]
MCNRATTHKRSNGETMLMRPSLTTLTEMSEITEAGKTPSLIQKFKLKNSRHLSYSWLALLHQRSNAHPTSSKHPCGRALS